MASKRPVVMTVGRRAILDAGRAVAHQRVGDQARERWRDPEYRALMREATSRAFTGRERSTTPKATVRPTIRDIAWAAGFIEGEGSVKRGTSLQICAAQVNQEPLLRLQSLFGGSITEHTAAAGKKSRATIWRVTGARGRGFAMTIYPFLSEKRKEQIRGAL